MKKLNPYLSLLTVVAAATLVGCSTTSARAPDLSASLRASLDQAGLKDVSLRQDREKGVVTLGGHVKADGDKSQAQSIAQSMVGSEVVSNQIAVIPPGDATEAKDVNSDLDKGIEGNLDAALIQDKLHRSVQYAVKNSVVTLTGAVDSEAKRGQAEKDATTVPNVQQVVNELQIKNLKATSSN